MHLVPSPSVRAPLCLAEKVDGHVLGVFCSPLPCGIDGRARFGRFLFLSALRDGKRTLLRDRLSACAASRSRYRGTAAARQRGAAATFRRSSPGSGPAARLARRALPWLPGPFHKIGLPERSRWKDSGWRWKGRDEMIGMLSRLDFCSELYAKNRLFIFACDMAGTSQDNFAGFV